MGEKTTRTSSVQTDCFCPCGYNLYAQVVHVDERLGIPVCRCPECGRYHAAATTQATQSPWASRFALVSLVMYMLLLLYGVVMATFGIGAIQYGFILAAEESTRGLTSQWYIHGSLLAQFLIRWLTEITFILTMLAGFSYMMLAASFFWHWRRDSYWNLLVVPLLTVGVTAWIGIENQDGAFLAATAIWRLAGAVLAVMLGMGLGVLWGRKAVRGLLTMLLVPRARQSFAFLWLVDGKPPPGLVEAEHCNAGARQPPPSPVE